MGTDGKTYDESLSCVAIGVGLYRHCWATDRALMAIHYRNQNLRFMASQRVELISLLQIIQSALYASSFYQAFMPQLLRRE